MATLSNASLIHGIRGNMGGLIFRQMNGKTVVSVKPSAPRKQSETQKQNRDKFRKASHWAKHILRTQPEKKSYYQHIAKKLNLPNDYTAAICEYMRKAKPKVISRSSFVATKNNLLHIQVPKAAFKIRRITAILSDTQGATLAEQTIMKYDREKQFHFKWTDDFPDAAFLTVITDEPGYRSYKISIADIVLDS